MNGRDRRRGLFAGVRISSWPCVLERVTPCCDVLQKREAAGPVHMNPIRLKISGTEYARNCLKPVESEDDEADDDAEDGDAAAEDDK